MAEALAKKYCEKVFVSYSAGTKIKDKINEEAVETIKKLYSIDMEENQYSKLIKDIPKVDIVITMGCNVQCPNIYSEYQEDWGLIDPSGKGKQAFEKTAKLIEEKVMDLKLRIQQNKI